jgi:hypothetical protein
MDPQQEEQPKGRVDAAAVLAIVFGIPSIFGFLVVLFSLVMLFDIPA